MVRAREAGATGGRMSGGPYNYSYIFKYIIIGERAGARFRAVPSPHEYVGAWPYCCDVMPIVCGIAVCFM